MKSPCDVAPIHSPTSLALASEVDSARMRMGRSSWLLMYRMRLVMTCRGGGGGGGVAVVAQW